MKGLQKDNLNRLSWLRVPTADQTMEVRWMVFVYRSDKVLCCEGLSQSNCKILSDNGQE